MYDGFEVLTEQSEMLASIQVDSSLPDYASIYSKCLPIFKDISQNRLAIFSSELFKI